MYIHVYKGIIGMELLTIQEVAQTMRVNPITVRRHIKAGNLDAVHVGRRVRVRKESVDRFIKPIVPKTPKHGSKMQGKPTSANDPLWKIVGMGRSKGPGDVSENVDKYLAEAYLDHHHG